MSDDRTKQLFAAMISGYATQGMVALGKMQNPMTGETERDLDQARAMIDLLAMLEVKTEGNRSEEESSLLQQAISTLRMNFVDESGKPDPATENGPEAGS